MKYLLTVILLFSFLVSFAQKDSQKDSQEDSTTYIRKKFLFFSYKKKVKQTAIQKDSLTLRKDSTKSVIARKMDRLKELLLQDSLRKIVVADTINYPFYKPDAIRIGVDGIWALNGVFSKDGVLGQNLQGERSYYGDTRGYDITADVSFKDNRYFLVTDVGYSAASSLKQSVNVVTRQRQNGFQYDIQGTYFRVGIDYNVMRRYFNNEVLFVGVRYGQSFFTHTLQYNVLPDSLWNINIPNGVLSPMGTISQSGLTANWYEIVGGLKVNLWKNIFVGYTVRLQFLGKISGENTILTRSFDSPYVNKYQGLASLKANDIPGYGNTEESFKLGFSFCAYYRFPFRKRPEVVLD